MKVRISRRRLALGLLAVAGGSAAGVWSFYGRDRSAVELDLPGGGNPFAPSYEVFLALSQIVLMREKLDEEIARRLFAVFSNEPWGLKHIGHAYAVLRDELAHTGTAERAAPISLARLGDGERWFVGHLVTTWYLGVYYHEERPTQRITYAGALMFDAVEGLLPVTYFESVGYGSWVEPPAAAREDGKPK
ncbi:MAG: sugar dehydrogenase complex small subunit [Xanthobacteraceae bacterium]